MADNELPRRTPAVYPKAEVAGIIGAALAGAQGARRHPAEVTSDRLGDAAARWYDQFTPEELDMLAQIRHALEEIAEGKRESNV